MKPKKIRRWKGTARERVLERHPSARVELSTWSSPMYRVLVELGDWQKTEAKAWSAAARRLGRK